MGCGPQPKVPSLQKADTLIGIIKLTVLDVYFPKDAQLKNPTLKVRISNQQYKTKTIPILQKQHKVNQLFTFTINSFYKAQGRTIQTAVFDQEDFIAYGAVDANPIINGKGQVHQFRCMLATDKKTKFGYATLQASFEQLPFTQVTFRFQSATIRRKIGASLVSVKLTIGEQQLQTKFQEETPNKPPIWKDQMFNYKIPDGIKIGQLELIDGDGKQIGSSNLDLTKILEARPSDEIFVAEELFYKDADNKEIDAANLKYSYIVGEKAAFSHIEDILRSSVRAIRTKNELNEPIIERAK